LVSLTSQFNSSLALREAAAPIACPLATVSVPYPRKDSVETMEGTPYECSESADFSEEELPLISLKEVATHCTLNDAWMVIYDRVYDVTTFIAEVNFDI